MSRRELREQIFKMLFRIEFHEGMEMEEQMQLFLEEEEEISKEDSEYIRNKYENIVEHLEEIDASVNESQRLEDKPYGKGGVIADPLSRL